MRKLLLAGLLLTTPAQATTQVCVEVQVKSWEKAEPPADAKRATADDKPSSPSSQGALLGNYLGQTLDPTDASIEEPTPESVSEPSDEASRAPPTAEPPRIPFVRESTPASNDGQTVKEAQPGPDGSAVSDPHEIDPARYLERMLEYEVSHEVGFLSVERGCTERVIVELYALDEGWTVFARYSGHAREEKVDRVELDEFVELAERIIRALLRDQSISDTMTRENVLRADSELSFRTIRGTSHLLFGMGTAVRVGVLPTATTTSEPARDQLRILTPIGIHLGYRGKLKAWGLDAFVRMYVGTATKGIRSNPLGGHVDYAGSGLAGLHFLRYQDAAGIGSVYFGGGASFELSYFQAIAPPDALGNQDRVQLLGGGLNLDALLGYEFLRSSSVHFFTEVEVQAPTYLVDTERGDTKLEAYLPGTLAQIGVVF